MCVGGIQLGTLGRAAFLTATLLLAFVIAILVGLIGCVPRLWDFCTGPFILGLNIFLRVILVCFLSFRPPPVLLRLFCLLAVLLFFLRLLCIGLLLLLLSLLLSLFELL